MNIVQIAALLIVCAVLAAAIKQYKPEIAVIIAIAGAVIAAVALLPQIEQIVRYLQSVGNLIGRTEELRLLIKALGIAILCEMSADICSDAGSTAAAGRIILAGKIAIVACVLPLAATIIELISELLK